MTKSISIWTRILTPEQILFLKKKLSFLKELDPKYSVNQSIFVHIPKSAGLSLVSALYDSTNSSHDTWKEYRARDRKKFTEYFKFSFVRHPEARLISAYNYLKQGGRTEIDKYWRDKYLSRHANISDFIQNGLKSAIDGGAEHFTPQFCFVYDKKLNLRVDYIGHYETLEKDFKFVADKLNLNTSLNIVNDSKKEQPSILSNADKQTIYKLYTKDYELFGYKVTNNTHG